MRTDSAGVRQLCVLMRQTAQGDERAFARLHQLTSRKMMIKLRTVCANAADSEDLLQDAYVRIWRNASKFDPARSSPITWMSTIVRNAAIDHVRLKRYPITSIENAADIGEPSDDVPDEFDIDRMAPLANVAIEKLPESRRQLLSLAYVDGHSRTELSERFGVPVGTIKTWLRRSLQAVKAECLAQIGPAAANPVGPAVEGIS